MSRKRRWFHPLWRSAPLILQIQQDFGVGLEVALSMFLGHVKACRMNLSRDGWPLNSIVLANSRTNLRDLVDFAWLIGMRVLPMTAVKNTPGVPLMAAAQSELLNTTAARPAHTERP